MVSDDGAERHTPKTMVAVLTRRGVVRSTGAARVTASRPCAVGPTGVTLYRSPLRSVHIPLERVDRFDVVLEETELDPIDRLALLTRDGRKLLVAGRLSDLLSRWHGLPLRATAQQLNNHITAILGARPSDKEPPSSRN